MTRAKCSYEKCMLPKNNRHYIWQVCYMVIGLAVLFFSAEDFTFFQTFLFLAPVVLDILNAGFKSKVLNGLRFGFGFLDGALLVACLLGMFGVIGDLGKSFAVSENFLYFSGVGIKKETVGIIIALNLIVPIVFYIGSPCQDAVHMMDWLRGVKKKEEAKKG